MKPNDDPKPHDASVGDRRDADVRDDLVAYLDGELDDAARARVEARLAIDPALADELAELRDTWDVLDLDEAPRTTDGFTERVLAETKRERERRWWVHRVAPVAAAAVLVLAVFATFRGGANDPARTPITETELAENLDLLEDLDLLEELGEDIEFLAWAEENEELPW